MERNTILILRLTEREDEAFDPVRPVEGTFGTGLEKIQAFDYRIDAQKLDDAEYRVLRRQVADIARPIPVRLIAPVSEQRPAIAPPVDGATWGVYGVV